MKRNIAFKAAAVAAAMAAALALGSCSDDGNDGGSAPATTGGEQATTTLVSGKSFICVLTDGRFISLHFAASGSGVTVERKDTLGRITPYSGSYSMTGTALNVSWTETKKVELALNYDNAYKQLYGPSVFNDISGELVFDPDED